MEFENNMERDGLMIMRHISKKPGELSAIIIAVSDAIGSQIGNQQN